MRVSGSMWFDFADADQPADDARFTPPAPATDAPPVLRGLALREALAELSYAELRNCLLSRLLPLHGGACAASGRQGHRSARQNGLLVAAEIPCQEFIAAVRDVWGLELCASATMALHDAAPRMSARQRFSAGQAIALVVTLAVVAAMTAILGVTTAVLCASVLGTLAFLAVVAVRALVLISPAPHGEPHRQHLEDRELPLYSVLVPMYRETRVVDRLLAALGHIDYPHDKLDIKLIIEQHDHAMRRALAGFNLPAHFEIITVPPGRPRTKPRALNYALQFAFGDLVTIYDAEDLPSPAQLRACAESFAAAPDRLACLQARLAIFNTNENWLTRQFSLEYATLFGEILPALASLGLPLPLGGTSNHFRASALREAGAWDPFNVTEDCDLGLRLSRAGYGTATVASDTFEEACIAYGPWHRQRARWLKGFLQTWLVMMRSPARCWRELGPGGFWVAQATTIGVFLSALLHPLLFVGVASGIWSAPDWQPSLLNASTWFTGTCLVVFVLGYGSSLAISLRSLRRNAMPHTLSALATLPLYWLLLTPAAWLALWQFVTDPHGWNKTPHGQSRLLDPATPSCPRVAHYRYRFG